MLSNGDFLYTEVVLVNRDNSEEATATAGDIQRRFLVCMFSSVLGVCVCVVCVCLGWSINTQSMWKLVHTSVSGEPGF